MKHKNPLNTLLSTAATVDKDLTEQANPGHGMPSPDPTGAAQTLLKPDEARREAKSRWWAAVSWQGPPRVRLLDSQWPVLWGSWPELRWVALLARSAALLREPLPAQSSRAQLTKPLPIPFASPKAAAAVADRQTNQNP
jgi:hypothetical protein